MCSYLHTLKGGHNMRTRIRSRLKLMMALVMMITLAACDKLPNNIVPGNDKPEEEVLTVPDFTGLTREDAEAWIDQYKINPETVFYTYEYNETVAAEKIFAQSRRRTDSRRRSYPDHLQRCRPERAD